MEIDWLLVCCSLIATPAQRDLFFPSTEHLRLALAVGCSHVASTSELRQLSMQPPLATRSEPANPTYRDLHTSLKRALLVNVTHSLILMDIDGQGAGQLALGQRVLEQRSTVPSV